MESQNREGYYTQRRRIRRMTRQQGLVLVGFGSVYYYCLLLSWTTSNSQSFLLSSTTPLSSRSIINQRRHTTVITSAFVTSENKHVLRKSGSCIINNDSSRYGKIRWSLPPLFAAKNNKKGSDDDDDVDIPPDWSEDDILAEFENDVDGVVVVGDDDDEDIVDDVVEIDTDDDEIVIAGKKRRNRKNNVDDDDDDLDDEIDLDEIDLDEEEEEEVDDLIAEEMVGDGGGYDWGEDEPQSLFQQQKRQQQPGDMMIEWDPEVDGIDYELQDDMNDANYMAQKERVEQDVAASQQRIADETFDAYEYVNENLYTPEEEDMIKQSPIFQAVEEKTQGMMIEEEDIVNMDDIEKEYSEVSDLMLDDPYPRHDPNEINFLEQGTGLTDDDMEEFDNTFKSIHEATQVEPWDKVMLARMKGLDGLSNQTLAEIEDCLEEIGGSAYNVTNWLLYDLNFNVSNLILAAVQHNPDAPVLFQHWYPQLVTYEKYQTARDRNFDFTWEDVEKADITELERYYAGFGYDAIPTKAPAETGIISLEDLDEEEIKMAAFENWMTEVYNPEGDRKDFDDDTLRDEDNVFSDYYESPQHPDLPAFQDAVDDLEDWNDELGEDAVTSDDPEIKNYRNMMGRSFDYKIVHDEEFEREFRGHLVIACTANDDDLEVAEKITKRFEKEFGKKVYVETRVMAVAREEDNVFEIWLESYEVDLLHSKKRATSNTKDWDGPAEVDDAQIDYLTERVRFLISDDARYSYRMEFEYAE